jgi:hypothetical protein
MKATLLLFASLFCAGLVRAQAPDCLPPPFILTAAGDVGGPGGFWDNRTLQCQTWTIAYVSSDYSGFTLSLEQAVGNDTPGTWEAYAGTTVASSASFGTAGLGVATFNSLSTTPGSSNAAPWVRIDVAGGSGNGSIRITMYGYRTGPTGGTGGGGGGGGGSGCPNPCPVTQDTTPWITQGTDPCTGSATPLPISTAASAKILSGSVGTKFYVCSVNIGPIGTATNVALVEGAGTTCGTGTAGMAGGATAADGWNIGANGGLTLGNGKGTVAAEATAGHDVCLILSATNQISGVLMYVQQ